MPTDMSNAHTGLSDFEAPEINRACTASRGRGNTRAVRAPLTSACACIARSSLRASRGSAVRRRRPPNRKERSPASAHMRKRQTIHPPLGKASPKPRAATRHLATLISANPSAVRIELGPGCITSTVTVAEETSTHHNRLRRWSTQMRLCPPGWLLQSRPRASQRLPSSAS